MFHSAGEIDEYWDTYQNELIKKFYGNEVKAKKPLPVYTPPEGSIVIPGLSGEHSLLELYLVC